MENTLENKAKFFAQYWGQNLRIIDDKSEVHDYTINEITLKYIKTIELKSIESITDEEAFKVAKIVSPMLFEGNGDRGGHYVDRSQIKSGWISVKHDRKIISVDVDLDGYAYEYHEDESYLRPSRSASGTDTLRRLGFVTRWEDLSIEDLISFGWVKLKTE